MPCSEMSSPRSSSSRSTRRPIVARISQSSAKATGKHSPPIAATPMSCGSSAKSGANSPTASVPQMPQTRCTEIAPTGSSSLARSSAMTDTTTIAPATNPTKIAQWIGITSAPAVMPTSPASAPLSVMDRSGVRWTICAVNIAPSTPAHAASMVVMNTYETAPGSPESTDPPLNPNQPNQSKKTPMVASGMLWPMMGLIVLPYLPRRGPRTITPASAAQPPTECTSVEPAKS